MNGVAMSGWPPRGGPPCCRRTLLIGEGKGKIKFAACATRRLGAGLSKGTWNHGRERDALMTAQDIAQPVTGACACVLITAGVLRAIGVCPAHSQSHAAFTVVIDVRRSWEGAQTGLATSSRASIDWSKGATRLHKLPCPFLSTAA